MERCLPANELRYLDELRAYLVSFFRRARPLFDLDDLETKARKEFEEKWVQGKVPGWEDVAAAHADASLYCKACRYSHAHS